MAVAQPLDLTCGIEIECLVLMSTPPDHSSYTAGHQYQGQELIHEALSKPIDVRCATCGVSHDFVLDLNPYMEQTDDEDLEYTKWTIDTDESLDLTVAESMKFHGTLRHVQVCPIEIKSRVLSLTRNLVSKEHAPSSGHSHEVSLDAEIDAVYRSLDRYFNSAESPKNVGLVVNHTCSTHVHIGNGRHGFPTSTVKNVLSLCVAHERLIDNLHSTSRINGSTILSASESWARLNHSFRYIQHATAPKVYNSPWSTHFAHTAFLQSNSAVPDEARKFIPEPVYPASRFEASPDLQSAAQRFDVPSWLTIITSAQDITDLRNLQQNSARQSTINLHNLQSYRLHDTDSFDLGYRKMTMEFRQHAGTLQSQETLPWLRVLVSLFRYAHDNSEADIQKLCLNNWADPSTDSIDYLRTIGTDADTIKHYEHALGSSVSQTYADYIRQVERDAVLRDSWDQYLTPVALDMIETRTAGISPWNVTSVIREKFARGGYGQFPARYLADMKLYKAAVNILTVGTRPSWAILPSKDSAIDLGACLFVEGSD